MFPIHTILCATDLSLASRNALALAAGLARDYKAGLEIVHVVQLPAAVYGEVFTELAEEGYTERAWADLRAFVPTDLGVPVQLRVEEGDAATEIVRVAEEIKSDLIVLGTHGRTGLSRLLLGSVAEQVLRRAPCPVLTVRTPVPATVPTEELEAVG